MAFGGTIKLQGEQEYRQALRKITDELKVVGTELSKVSSQFGKNEKSVESLTAKNNVLTDKLNEQKKALDLTKNMLEKAQTEYENSVKSVADLKDELDKAQKALENAKNGTEATADEISELESNVGDLTNKLSAAEKETEAYETTVRKWKAEVNKAETAVNNTTREINENKSAIDKLDSATDKAADEIDDLSDSMKDASKKSDKLSDDLDELKGATKKAGDGFTVFKGVLADLVSNGINFVLNGIHNLVGEAISASDTLYKFEQTMGFAGYDSSVIEEASDRVKDYADKTVYNLDTIANTTAQLAANGIKDYSGLTEALGNLNAVAGGNADTFTSVASALTQTAGAGKLTTENWNQVANAIPGASGKLQEALKEAGAYTGDFREAMAKGEITAEEFNAAIMKLGNEPVAVEAATSVATFEGAIGNLQATIVTGLQQIISEIGTENITGFLSKLTEMVGKAIKAISAAVKWVKKNLPAVLTLVIGLTTAYTAQVVANKVAIIAATAAEKGMTVAQYAAATAQKALNLAMSANPIGLIIAGITALVAAFMLLWKNCEGFREFWINLWNTIKEAVAAVGEWFSNLWNNIVTWFKDIWNGVVEFFSGVWQSIAEFPANAWNAIKEIWSFVAEWFNQKVIEPIKNFFSSLFDGISKAASDTWNAIKGIWNGVAGWFNNTVIQPVKNFFTGAWNALKTGATNAWDGIKSVFKAVPEWFETKFKTAWQKVKDVFSTGGRIFDGIKDGILNGFKVVVNAIIRGINKVISLPFNGINKILRKIHNISILGKKPFSFIDPIDIPEIPELAKGGVINRPTTAVIGEAGKEAVVPLENNTGWIRRIAEELHRNLNGISVTAPQRPQNAAENAYNETKYTYLVTAFKDALKDVKVVMDSDEMGRFVERTVADAIYT